MDWIYEIALKRKSQRSTVFIVQTLDAERIKKFLVLNHDRLFLPNGKRFRNVIQYNILKGTLIRKEIDYNMKVNWREIDIDESPLSYIDNLIRKDATLVIIYYIYEEDQARQFINYLLEWSINLDEDIYQNHSLIVLFTASREYFPEVVRKFCYTLTVPFSTPEERAKKINDLVEEILTAQIMDEGETKEIEKLRRKLKPTREIILSSSGLDLHLVESATFESIFKARSLKPEYYTMYKVDLLSQYGIEYIEPRFGFEAVGGYHLLKEYIRERIIDLIKNPAEAEKYGLTPPRGIIMFGLPGTGKTHLATALAKEIKLPVLKIDASTFLRGIVGHTERRVKEVRSLIENFSPAIVFIDEIDQLTMARGRVMSTDSGVSRRLTNMLLDWFGDKERKSIIIGATNFIGDIDPAFLRPGRVDALIPVLLPDRDARAEIFRVHTRILRKIPIDDVNFIELAEETKMMTGAEIEQIVIEASFKAKKEGSKVGQKHLLDAIRDMNFNIEKRKSEFKRFLDDAREITFINKGFLRELLEEYSIKEGDKARAFMDYL